MVKNQVDLAMKGKIKIKSNRDIVFLAVSLLASAASLCFIVGPAYAGVQAAQEENMEKEKDIKSKQEFLANIKAFNEENKNVEVDTNKLEAFISNRNNYEDYFFHLEELARQSNLEITSMELQSGNGGASASTASPSASVGSTDATGSAVAGEEGTTDVANNGASGQENAGFQLQEQYINLSVKGSFGNIVYFYKSLENGIPFLQEISMDLSPSQQSGESGGPSGGQEQSPDPVLESKMSLKFNHY